MKCFNCGCDIVDTEIGACTNCSAIFNATKTNFISYIGAPDSLAGYQKSYKLLLLKYIIEAILDDGEASVARVIPDIKHYYFERKRRGLQPDYDVDARIYEIETSSDYDVFAVVKSQPFRVINEKGYLFINHNREDKLIFAFNDDIADCMLDCEWKKLLRIVDAKLELYFKRYDELNKVTSKTEKPETSSNNENETEILCFDLKLSVLEIPNLSVRAKNILMRNELYTVADVLEFIKDNDLRSLKNMGQKTFEEILSVMTSYDVQPNPCLEIDSIADLFAENKYHLFVDFCKRNRISSLSDLKNFDFSILLNEPGFGATKLEAIKQRYYDLLKETGSTQAPYSSIGVKEEKTPLLTVDSSNIDLTISFLRYAGISQKNITRFFESGYSKIGDLNNITLIKLVQMYGRKKAQDFLAKLKIFENPLIAIASDLLNQHKNNREFEIYIDRANKKTLQEIADKCGLTRERVRQIEMNFFKEFAPIFVELIEQCITKNNLSYISSQDVLEIFDDDSFDTVIMYTLKESSSLEYLSFADMFIKKQSETQNTYEKLKKLTFELIGDEGINFFERLQQIEEMLNNSGLDFISTDAFLNYLFEIKARFYGDFVFLKKQPYVKLCLILVSKYFKNGINLYSDEDINLLRNYFRAEFGEYELPPQNRAISARLSDYLIICDRGKAKLIENINFEQSVIDDIKSYIDTSPLKTLYFREIFNEFEGVLTFTSDINNYHALHGVLVYLYRNEYEFSRDSLTKKNSEGASLSISDRIIMFIAKKNRAVTRTEIKQEIGGLTDGMLFNSVNSSKLLMQWDYNSFNVLDNLHITTNDASNLETIIENLFVKFKGYCSDRQVFEKVRTEYIDFIAKNRIENATNLFYILQNIFGSKYRFSRPHICQKGSVDSLTTKNIALYLLGTTQQISRSNFMRIAKSVYWSETTADLIFYELEKDYIRISEDIYILSNDFHIDECALKQIYDWLKNHIATHGYLSMIGFDDFSDLPAVQYGWNSFLLVSVIKKYELGMRLVSPAIRDRRYNKEIIVFKDSQYSHLDDIIYTLLVKNNITFIDEATLLSFLVINHLVVKVIPKEIFDSKNLNYADGYFRII